MADQGEEGIRLGGNSPPDSPITPPSPSPYRIAMHRLSPGERFLYYLYVLPLSIVLVGLSLFASIPYMFCKRSRPRLPKEAERDPDHPDSDYEWYGIDKDYPAGTALAPLGKGPGLRRRLWEMYGFFREFWHMAYRQGLQIGGVLSGIVILVWQIEMMWHDFSASSITEYQSQISGASGDSSGTLTSDSTCAYATGTGIANWGSKQEPLAWYGCYHGMLCILAICLIGDELLNVRFGCFAPQWYRGGIGYTIMFLVSATLSTSPNWGLTTFIQLRYVGATCIFLLGVYNVLRTLACSVNIATSGYIHTDYRVGRKPLRPWTESEWLDGYYRLNFIPHQYDRYFFTEMLQHQIGDQDFPHTRRPREDIEAQIEKLENETENPYIVDASVQKIYRRTRKEVRLMQGKIKRNIIRGGTLKMPPRMMEDLRQRERMHIGVIDPRHPPTEEEEAAMIKMIEKDKGYYGIADWKPRNKDFRWWWFDLRRLMALICAAAVMGVRIGLCVFDLDSSNLTSYRTQYDEIKDSWDSTDTGGPDSSLCQYYEGSSVAIFIVTGEGSNAGVTANLIWLGIWHVFLIGMCIAIILVSVSNNMWWGMHWPFPPITLIGPRKTSMSSGITLAFVTFATLQQGFFFNNDSLITITRIICYISLAVAILHLYPNEELTSTVTRDPFWAWTSRVAFRFMNRKKWHYEMVDFEDSQN